MNRETQLSNVAFGGAWSEEIAGQEALQQARKVLEEAVERCAMDDLRKEQEVNAVVRLLSAEHPKEAMLAQAWERSCGIEDRTIRRTETGRVAAALLATAPTRYRD